MTCLNQSYCAPLMGSGLTFLENIAILVPFGFEWKYKYKNLPISVVIPTEK